MPAIFQPWLGVFETLRVVHGRPLFLREHYENLCGAAAALRLDQPPDFTSRLTSLPARNGRWRWIHRTEESLDFFQEEEFFQTDTFTLALAEQRLGSHNWDARYKTLSYLTHGQARQAVRADEALLLNERGHIATGAMSNIFWVESGRLFTPAVDAGCRAGVVRHWILTQRPVKEIHADLSVLEKAEEIFLTNSLIGVQPVTHWNRKTRAPGPITSQLRTAYAAQILGAE